MKQKTVVVVSGGFDPIHSGHIAYFNAAKSLGDILVVGLNSDEWLRRKKGKEFLPFQERSDIISELRMVNIVSDFNDDDNTALDLISIVLNMFPGHYRVIFANGGDRTAVNIPEMVVKDPRLEFVFGVGGEDKKNSSSWILKKWEAEQ
jgi:D-beta-D-heptose 7-phosphate kinase/D-beta-D-heptose 1-phosphate adenosyltransferase